MNDTFSALQTSIDKNGKAQCSIVQRQLSELSEGEVTICVAWSSLNFKDALSASGNRGVTRNYPHTPGIDAAGEVSASESDVFAVGDKVLVTGYDLGMNTSGGFAEYIRVPASWVVPIPTGLDPRSAMFYGTAGFTAAQAVNKIVASCKPEDGEVVVSGARGGVATIALALLHKLGYRTVAVTRNPGDAAHLREQLGVSQLISHQEFIGEPKKHLFATRWAAGLDTVGGEVLAAMLKSALPMACITCCGNAASIDLPISVFPFILRGVTLSGVDSQNCPMQSRQEIWRKLACEWKLDSRHLPVQETTLAALPEHIDAMLSGVHAGRRLVKVAHG